MKTKDFFYYHARTLAIDPQRPWQVCSVMGSICGKFATRKEAEETTAALQHDKDAGNLPCDLISWYDKRKS